MDTDDPKKNSSKKEMGAVGGFFILLFMAFYGVIAYRIIAIHVGNNPFLTVQFYLDNGAAEYALGPWWTLVWALIQWFGMLAGAFVAVVFGAVASVMVLDGVWKRIRRFFAALERRDQEGNEVAEQRKREKQELAKQRLQEDAERRKQRKQEDAERRRRDRGG